MSQANEEERFSANIKSLTDLVHELTSMCWDAGNKQINPTLIMLAGAYLSSFNKVELIEIFIENTHEICWEKIRNRNENFFIEHSEQIFGKLPISQGNIDAFKILFTAKDQKGESIISDEDKDAIWDHFGTLVKICIKYVHRVRECYLFEDKEKNKFLPKYRHNRFPQIKVREHAKKWDIELFIPKV